MQVKLRVEILLVCFPFSIQNHNPNVKNLIGVQYVLIEHLDERLGKKNYQSNILSPGYQKLEYLYKYLFFLNQMFDTL